MMEIINSTQKENLLLRRKEIKIDIRSKVVPTSMEAKKIISEKFSAPRENIRVKKIDGRFGSHEFTLSANIYHSQKDKDETELISKKEKEKEAKAEQAQKEVTPKQEEE